MRVLIGATLLIGFIGGVLLLITAEHVRAALPWTTVNDWGDFTVNLPINIALVTVIALIIIGFPWRAEMDALRPAWIGLAAAVLAVIASVGVWSTFALWMLNFSRVRVVEPSAFALGAALVWFVLGALFWAWVLWDLRRWRVERAIERRDPKTEGVRSFAGHIVEAPGEPAQRDPLDGSTCVSWTADGTREDIWEEAELKGDESAGNLRIEWVETWRQRKEFTGFDSAVSPFYLLVDGVYVYVRPDRVRMRGRIGSRVKVEVLRHVDDTLAEKMNAKDLLYVRTRVLRAGDAVVATGVITADAEGRLSLQAKPANRRLALVPTASVRLIGRMPRDRRHRKAMKMQA